MGRTKGSKNTRVGAIRGVWSAAEEWGLNKFVYIRGTQEGYENIEPKTTTFITSKAPKFSNSTNLLLSRYIDLKRLATQAINSNSTSKDINEVITLKSVQDIQRIQAESMQGILQKASASSAEHLRNAQESVDKGMQTLISELQTFIDEQDGAANEILIRLQQQPEIAAALNLLQSLSSAEGQILHWPETLTNSLLRLINALKSRASTTSNKELSVSWGLFTEYLQVWLLQNADKELSQMAKEIEKSIGGTGQSRSQIKVQGTGSLMHTAADNAFSAVSKPDAAVYYYIKKNNKKINLQMGVSLKTSGAAYSKRGINELRDNSFGIHLLSKGNAWSLLRKVFGNTKMAQNSLMNALVWENQSSEVYTVITKSIARKFFEKIVAGGGEGFSGTNIRDFADVMVVNGIGIPVVSIVARAGDYIDSADANKKGFVNIRFSIAQNARHKKSADEAPSRAQAFANSTTAVNQIINGLTMQVSLNSKQLAQLARKSM